MTTVSIINRIFMSILQNMKHRLVDGELLAGSLPVKQLRLVQAWATSHEDELYAAWNNAIKGIPFGKIDPLH